LWYISTVLEYIEKIYQCIGWINQFLPKWNHLLHLWWLTSNYTQTHQKQFTASLFTICQLTKGKLSRTVLRWKSSTKTVKSKKRKPFKRYFSAGTFHVKTPKNFQFFQHGSENRNQIFSTDSPIKCHILIDLLNF
jgi:hypothetical protein